MFEKQPKKILNQKQLAKLFGSWKREKFATRLLQGEKQGQALVLLAVAFFALLAFIGLVTDVGSIYISYTQLQRAVDAAAVAAANNIKNPSGAHFREKIVDAASEMLAAHQITGVSDMQLYICDDASKPASFEAMCTEPKRKLAYISATQQSPVYFLQIFGVRSFPLTATAVGETAAVDLVLVVDTSESMGKDTTGYNPNNFDPGACNSANNCQPLRQAKDAAQNLVANLYPGYDRVAIVTFDVQANLRLGLSGALTNTVPTAITNDINLHNDLAAAQVRWTLPSPMGGYRAFNPIYPEDRDGDGKDTDPNAPCTDANLDGWDDTTGNPCDQNNIADAIDWNHDGVYTDGGGAPGWYSPAGIPPSFDSTSLLSTCSGCGLRVATETLAGSGRPGAVWVIVYLSDGVSNLSDTPTTDADPHVVPSNFTYGYCGPGPNDNHALNTFWSSYCIDTNSGFSAGRYCIDDITSTNTCPPQSNNLALFPNFIYGTTNTSGPYSVEDYAYDQVDRAGLLSSTNINEPKGEDIVMFSVGLGSASGGGINLLRYISNIGDDGTRSLGALDPCYDTSTGLPKNYTVSCGNYYYAPTGAYLSRIFENIAGRIFTKISR